MMGLPLFLEDTTGYSTGPTDFFDIYDRPPFIHVENRVELVARKTNVHITELNVRHGSPLKHSAITLSLRPGMEGYVVFRNKGQERVINVSDWLSKPVQESRFVFVFRCGGIGVGLFEVKRCWFLSVDFLATCQVECLLEVAVNGTNGLTVQTAMSGQYVQLVSFPSIFS